MYLLFCTDFYIFRNFVFFVFLVVQYRRSVIYKIKRLDTNTRDFGYTSFPVKLDDLLINIVLFSTSEVITCSKVINALKR